MDILHNNKPFVNGLFFVEIQPCLKQIQFWAESGFNLACDELEFVLYASFAQAHFC